MALSRLTRVVGGLVIAIKFPYDSLTFGWPEYALRFRFVRCVEQPVEHDDVLAGEYRIGNGLDGNAFVIFNMHAWHAIPYGDSLWKFPAIAVGRGDIQSRRRCRTQMMDGEYGWPPKIGGLPDARYSTGVCIKSFGTWNVFVKTIKSIAQPFKLSSLRQFHERGVRDAKRFGLLNGHKTI